MNSTQPPKTIIDYINVTEQLKFKERRRFQSYKDKAHFYFDKIWRDTNIMTRSEAYLWLGERLDLQKNGAHFTNMNKIKCTESIWFCQQLLNDNRRLDMDFGKEPITPFYVL